MIEGLSFSWHQACELQGEHDHEVGFHEFFLRDGFDAGRLSHRLTDSANPKSVTMLSRGSDYFALWKTHLPQHSD
jgi:hypothetical protein